MSKNASNWNKSHRNKMKYITPNTLKDIEPTKISLHHIALHHILQKNRTLQSTRTHYIASIDFAWQPPVFYHTGNGTNRIAPTRKNKIWNKCFSKNTYFEIIGGMPSTIMCVSDKHGRNFHFTMCKCPDTVCDYIHYFF